MISTSRFNDALRKLNILDSTETSILKLRITDPGVNIMKGQIANISRDKMPLTLMASQGIKGNDGLNVDGYNDYKGVPVMGAWGWIDEFDFGSEFDPKSIQEWNDLNDDNPDLLYDYDKKLVKMINNLFLKPLRNSPGKE